MAIRDRLLAVFVAVLWGLNFIAIHATLGQFPPMFAGALRFLLIAIPTVFLVPRPRVKLRYLLGYGLGFGTGQFAFLFVAMHLGMPTGLASLVLQASAPFTVLLGAVLLRERVSGRQLAGILLAVAGMTAIAWQQSAHAALVPVLLTLLAALSWAIGNLSMRRAEPDNPLHLTLWMSVVPPLPMLALSSIFEGPGAAWHSLATLGTKTGLIGIAGLAYVVVFGTVVGSGIWTTLMRRNPAGVVAPFSLLVPVVGLTASFFILGEEPTVLTLVAAAVVIGGVLLGSLRRKPAVTPEELLPV
ncbi:MULTISPECIES: EamA family transporter [Amycolatopsis]|uniref:EamA family transporter n=1 Tax=Amycolatopsis dendrobii TaxID=2760662 RepID=A0A7W3VYX1_9PSEU|nr:MULTISPECIES: EamA family transporter [Amycolatopsis]MBB1155614.1 EamA family transporter [Amycolatopsis dendrobii]UKD52826.1 EamA family transporter [Amycolatopsis sp. FU40]